MHNVVDLGNLARPTTQDEHLAGIVRIAQANPGVYRDVVDDDTVEEAFVLGFTRALASFVTITTGGLVDVPEDVLLQCGYLAFVDLRGMMWVSALASTRPSPEDDELRFDPDLVVAYLTARKAADVAENALSHMRDQIARIVNREAEAEAAKVAFLTDPRALRGAT